MPRPFAITAMPSPPPAPHHPPLPDLHSAHQGRIHSVETSSAVDGPGLRYVIFTQGCLLRCQYCHNPDTRDPLGGKVVTVDELIEDIQHYQSYLTYSGGGVTVTGGEPLLQPEFVREIFRRCRSLNIHTALDTSGFPDFEASKPVLDYTDLVLLDLKSFDPETQRTKKVVQKVVLLPIAEVAFGEEATSRFRSRYVELFGGATGDDPLYEAVSNGQRYPGQDHWLPLFHDRLDTLFDYVEGADISFDYRADEAV